MNFCTRIVFLIGMWCFWSIHAGFVSSATPVAQGLLEFKNTYVSKPYTRVFQDRWSNLSGFNQTLMRSGYKITKIDNSLLSIPSFCVPAQMGTDSMQTAVTPGEGMDLSSILNLLSTDGFALCFDRPVYGCGMQFVINGDISLGNNKLICNLYKGNENLINTSIDLSNFNDQILYSNKKYNSTYINIKFTDENTCFDKIVFKTSNIVNVFSNFYAGGIVSLTIPPPAVGQSLLYQVCEKKALVCNSIIDQQKNSMVSSMTVLGAPASDYSSGSECLPICLHKEEKSFLTSNVVLLSEEAAELAVKQTAGVMLMCKPSFDIETLTCLSEEEKQAFVTQNWHNDKKLVIKSSKFVDQLEKSSELIDPLENAPEQECCSIGCAAIGRKFFKKAHQDSISAGWIPQRFMCGESYVATQFTIEHYGEKKDCVETYNATYAMATLEKSWGRLWDVKIMGGYGAVSEKYAHMEKKHRHSIYGGMGLAYSSLKTGFFLTHTALYRYDYNSYERHIPCMAENIPANFGAHGMVHATVLGHHKKHGLWCFTPFYTLTYELIKENAYKESGNSLYKMDVGAKYRSFLGQKIAFSCSYQPTSRCSVQLTPFVHVNHTLTNAAHKQHFQVNPAHTMKMCGPALQRNTLMGTEIAIILTNKKQKWHSKTSFAINFSASGGWGVNMGLSMQYIC